MRTGVEALRQTASLDDERLGSHRPWDDSISSCRRVNRALACDENFFAIMLLERNVVVVTVNFQLRLEWLAMIEHLVEYLQQTRHHDLAILHRVSLRPLQVLPVRLEFGSTRDEVSEVRSRQFVQTPQALRGGDVTLSQFLTDVARTRVQHEPNEVFRIQTNFDEVVSTTKRSQLLHRLRFAIVNTLMKFFELVPAFPVRGIVNRLLVCIESGWNCFFNLQAQLLQLTVEDAALERSLHSHHSATDVDADRCRNYCFLRGNNRPHHASLAQVRV